MSSTTNGSATSGETKKGRVSAKKSQDGPWTKLKAVIYPDWAQEGMKSSRSWKTFARCMIALFCTMVLLVDNSCKCDSLVGHLRMLTVSPAVYGPSRLLRSHCGLPVEQVLITGLGDAPSFHGAQCFPLRHAYSYSWSVFWVGLGMRRHGCWVAGERSGLAAAASSDRDFWVGNPHYRVKLLLLIMSFDQNANLDAQCQ